MSLATVFGATAAVLGATAVVHAANVQLTVRRRRRERAARRGSHGAATSPSRNVELSRPLRTLVEDATALASRLDQARLAGDVAWAKAVVARGDRQWNGSEATAEDAAYMAAVGDALRATSSLLARFDTLPSADAELVTDRAIVADALRELLAAGPSDTTPEAIDALEYCLDRSIAALDRLVGTLTTHARRPYR
jgi:hypothetical protein